MTTRRLWVLLVVVFAAGCGGGRQAEESPDAAKSKAFEELAEGYGKLAKMGTAVAIDDQMVKEFGVSHPRVEGMVGSGDLVLLHGPVGSKPDVVAAYEKNAPESGGLVMMQDGTVKTMTAAEFAAAPKAGKK